MIKPICCICGNELTEFGGILLSPPDGGSNRIQLTLKRHICNQCYEKILETFNIRK